MSNNTVLDQLIARSNECRKAMSSLVKRYGSETCEWALRTAVAEHATKPGPGRKTEISSDHLRDIWLFVEAGKSRYKQSTLAFCNRAKFDWVSVERTGARVTKTLRGATLRRRYQQAVALLRAEAASYRKLAKHEGLPNPDRVISPTEVWWRSLLSEGLGDTLSGNPPRK